MGETEWPCVNCGLMQHPRLHGWAESRERELVEAIEPVLEAYRNWRDHPESSVAQEAVGKALAALLANQDRSEPRPCIRCGYPISAPGGHGPGFCEDKR